METAQKESYAAGAKCLTSIENEIKRLMLELKGLNQTLLDGACLESTYMRTCRDLQSDHISKLEKICYKSITDIIELEKNRTIELNNKKHNEKCDDISLIPFKSIYLEQNKMSINLSRMGSKWKSKLVSRTNPKDNTTYNRYVTTIEADPLNGIGAKMHHGIVEGRSIYGADWLYIETDKPLIKTEMTFAPEYEDLGVDTDEDLGEDTDKSNMSKICEENKANIDEPVLSFGYLVQEGYKPPVYYHFPKKIQFMKNRIEFSLI